MDEMVVIEAAVAEPLVDLEQRIAELEARVSELMRVSASAAVPMDSGRKTVKTFAASAGKGEAMAAGALDAAFTSLSVEQRIAVKMEMMRGGLLV